MGSRRVGRRHRRSLCLTRFLPASDGVQLERPQVGKDSPVTIIYTSGTSGEAKGVVLTAANVGFMLDRTAERLEQLMSGSSSEGGQDRIFHYLPFTFAASWIALLTFSEAAEPGHHQYGSGEDRE